MSQATSTLSREPRELQLDVGVVDRPEGPFPPKDWLCSMTFAVRTMAAGAELVPLPYIRVAFDAVVLFLETADKVKKNREDLKDLCASMVEIVVLLRDEISVNGNTGAIRFKNLCEDFIGCMKFLQLGLEKLQKSHQGIRGRFKEVVGATSVEDQIRRYRTRLDELRSNFTLIATINTNINVTDIQRSFAAIQSPHSRAQFRQVALGDINLLYETPMTNRVHQIKMFTARISGEGSTMTIAKYEDEKEKWKQDLALYSSVSVWQLFGVSQAPGWQALIFYDELMPLAVYRQFYRPSSDLVWACIEGMLFKQFKDSKQYCQWKLNNFTGAGSSTICVRREPIQLSLSLACEEWSYAVDRIHEKLSKWYSMTYKFQPSESAIVPIVTTFISPDTDLREALIRQLGFRGLYKTLTAPWRSSGDIPFALQGQYHLGTVVADPGPAGSPFRPLGFMPHACSNVQVSHWSMGGQSKLDATDEYNAEQHACWKRFTFPPCSFQAALNPWKTFFMAFIKLDSAQVDLLHQAWLSQANKFLSNYTGNNEDRMGVIDMITCYLIFDKAFQGVLRHDGTTVESHLFACPLQARKNDTRFSLALPESDQYYWALDSAGTTRLSQEESDRIGLPRFRFGFQPWATLWEPYHYNAVREFHQAKGFDPYSLDVTRLLGLPVMQTVVEA
ncbi:hypothetical protein FB451DRAFT_1567112 [Mycena latifolia]|nr:hypothetical protein FB451DRAFT_1567112 [Mycena latifolia]